MAEFRIAGWSPHESGGQVACNWQDKSAVRFTVHYPGSPYGMGLDFSSRSDAERISRALQHAFAAGGCAKLAELRKFLGVK